MSDVDYGESDGGVLPLRFDAVMRLVVTALSLTVPERVLGSMSDVELSPKRANPTPLLP